MSDISIEDGLIESLVSNMAKDPEMLKSGYQLLSKYEMNRNFYLNLLKLIFSGEAIDNKSQRLACSVVATFLKKNWSDDSYITNEERMVNL